MDEQIIRVLRLPVGGAPEVMWIGNDYKEMQKIVEGDLEGVTVEPGIMVMCNENGIALGQTYNRTINRIDFRGPIFITRYDPETGDSVSLTESDIEKWSKA